MKKTYLFLFILLLLKTLSVKAQNKTIDYFLEQANQNSPLLKNFDLQSQTLNVDQELVKAFNKPQVTGNANLMYAPVIKGYGYDNVITNGQVFNALIGINQQLNNKKRMAALLKDLSLSKDSLHIQKQLNKQSLAQIIGLQYINTWADQQLAQLSSEVYGILNKEDGLLKDLTRNAVFKQTAYLAFKVNLTQQQLVLGQSKNQLKTDFEQLNNLAGIVDTSVFTLKAVPLNAALPPDFDTSSLARSFLVDSLKNAQSLKLLALNYQPKLSVFADGGYNSSLTIQPYKNFGLSAGLGLSIPIYDGGQKKLNAQKIKLKQLNSNNYKAFAQNQYQQQKQLLISGFNRLTPLIQQSKAQIIYAKTLIAANEKQLQTGDISITDYLLSVANYLQVKANLIQYQTHQMQIAHQLKYFTVK